MTAHLRLRAAAVAALAAGTLVAAGCGGDGTETTGAQRLGAAGATWAQLGDGEQRDTLRACRLKAAVAAATAGGVRAVPYYTTRYDAVIDTDGTALHDALNAFFGDTGPGRGHGSIGEGCQSVLAGLAALTPTQAGPLADFAAPVDGRHEELRLQTTQPDVLVDARLTPADARLTLAAAPGRAVSTARVSVAARDGIASVRLQGLPAGVSYLQARVTAGGRTWERLLVVEREDRTVRRAHTFAPMTLRGDRSRGLRVLNLPVDGRVTIDAPAAPLTVATGDALLLAHAADDRTPQIIPAGRYRDVRIATSGPWTMTIVPAA
jgi:hypothetical protein